VAIALAIAIGGSSSSQYPPNDIDTMSNGGSFDPSSGNISNSVAATVASSVSPYELSARSQWTFEPGARLAKMPAMNVPCPAAGSRTWLPSPS
jgi:hypothetical protein